MRPIIAITLLYSGLILPGTDLCQKTVLLQTLASYVSKVEREIAPLINLCQIPSNRICTDIAEELSRISKQSPSPINIDLSDPRNRNILKSLINGLEQFSESSNINFHDYINMCIDQGKRCKDIVQNIIKSDQISTPWMSQFELAIDAAKQSCTNESYKKAFCKKFLASLTTVTIIQMVAVMASLIFY